MADSWMGAAALRRETGDTVNRVTPGLGDGSAYGSFFSGKTVTAVIALAVFLALLQGGTLRLLDRS